MEFIFKAIGITILVVIVALYYLEFFKAVRERKIINSRINNNVLQTEDIKIWSKTVFNFDDKFDYCKFYFFEDEVYIKFKNTSPKLYSIPFVLKKNSKRKYSYFNIYNIVRFESKGSKINLMNNRIFT